MASIRKRNNTYQITVSCGRDIHGKKIIQTTTYTPTATTPRRAEKEVEAFAQEFEDKVRNGLVLEGDKITFVDFMKRWEIDYAAEHITTSTLEGYQTLAKLYLMPSIGNIKISKIKAPHLNKIFKEMSIAGKSHSTIRKVYAVASSIFTRAYKWSVIDENPVNRVELPTRGEKSAMQCFTVEQAQIFLNALTRSYSTEYKAHTRIHENGKQYTVRDYTEHRGISQQLQLFYTLALFGGFRRGELIALTWADVDFENRTISITKAATTTRQDGQTVKPPKTSSGNRRVSLPASCFSLLQNWYTEQKRFAQENKNAWKGKTGKQYNENYVFIQDDGQMMHLSTPTHRFRQILEAHNRTARPDEQLPLIRLHDLRHTSASLLIAENVDIKTVSSRLGHSDTSLTLNVYVHTYDTLDKRAAETLDSLLTAQ